MSTIQDRGYVWKKGSALVPSFTAFAVVRVLEQHFPDLVDYAFTARMEDDLDDIAAGAERAVPWLSRFYFGDADEATTTRNPHRGIAAAGLKQLVSERLDEIDPRAVNAIPIGVDESGQPVVVRVGRYGPYLSRGEDRAGVPEELPPDELTIERALELLAAPGDDRELGVEPDSNLPVYVRTGRFGPYIQLGGDDENGGKPKRASLFKDMDAATIGFEDAIRLLALPRTLGELEGDEVVAQNGRFGPFIKKGPETRSLATEADLFTVTLDEALALLAEPKRRRGQGAPKPPLRELGPDPVSQKPMVVKEGRFGPYVTDGETNASLRKGDVIEELSTERGAELLQERREKEAAGLVGKGRASAGRSRAAAGSSTVKKKSSSASPSGKSGAGKSSAKAAKSTTKSSTGKSAAARISAASAATGTSKSRGSTGKNAASKAAATENIHDATGAKPT
jgi:DNA topoisomerase-1